MKISILIIVLFIFFSCKKEEKLQSVVSNVKSDSSVIQTQNQVDAAELTDEEILKEQAEREKELSKIVNTFSETKVGNGFVYELECRELVDGTIGFNRIKIFKEKKIIK